MAGKMFCPICSDGLDDNFTHILKHFKYRRFPCGENSCDAQFYADSERTAHCSKTGHKKSFQKTVNPYIEMLVDLIKRDAVFLKDLELDAIVAARVESHTNSNETLLGATKNHGNVTRPQQLKKRPITTPKVVKHPSTRSEESPRTKKTRIAESENESGPTTDATVSTTSMVNGEDNPATPNTQALSSSRNQTPAEKDKRKRTRNESSTGNSERNEELADQRIGARILEASTNLRERLVEGWYDPNDPERQDLTLVKCNVCKKDVSYDYIVRKDHVGREHINADVAADEYEEVLKDKMNEAFPDIPNTDLSCQLCISGPDIRICARREHIERSHFLNLPELVCPVEKCRMEYRRQCELGAHMRDAHKVEMPRFKCKEFQETRRRRNVMINEMTNKCFPMAQYSILMKTARDVAPVNFGSVVANAQELSNVALDKAFGSDVRVNDISRTRRAPTYREDDESSSDDENGDGEQEKTREERNREVEIDDNDVIFVRETFVREVNKKLQERAKGMLLEVKQEEVEVEEKPEIQSSSNNTEPTIVVEETSSRNSVERIEPPERPSTSQGKYHREEIIPNYRPRERERYSPANRSYGGYQSSYSRRMENDRRYQRNYDERRGEQRAWRSDARPGWDARNEWNDRGRSNTPHREYRPWR